MSADWTRIDGEMTPEQDAACERVAELTYRLLLEVGRRDLADAVVYFIDDDGIPYLEPFDFDDFEVRH